MGGFFISGNTKNNRLFLIAKYTHVHINRGITMSLEAKDVLLANFLAQKAMGAKIIDADATMTIDHEGFESSALIFKEFPHPAPNVSGEVAESFGANGQKFYQPTNSDTAQQGSVVMYLYANGDTDKLIERIKTELHGQFNALVYEGTENSHLRSYKLRDCILTLEAGTRSHENKSQTFTLNGQLSFHYFSEAIEGNTKTLY